MNISESRANELLKPIGLSNNKIFYNLSPSELSQKAVELKEGVISDTGALISDTGRCTGRSPNDRFIVEDSESSPHIDWGKVNMKISPENFDKLYAKAIDFLQGQDLYVMDCFCGADRRYRQNIRAFTTKAWHSMFVSNMFINATEEELKDFTPDFTIVNACGYTEPNWKEYGLNSEIFILLNLKKKILLVCGTEYSGEMKKGIFAVMNYLLPLQNVLPMHCSANSGDDGDTVLFFGLSGTGKTTLSTDHDRHLIGDDEHGWSDTGVFNFEGGCYAKCINLSAEKEPDIWNAIKPGAILENVIYDEKGHVDFTNSSKTENTRVSYPASFIDNFSETGMGEIPKNIIFLTCDAFGILPPVARLTPGEASFHFLSGYTAKVAGTERGVTEPTATFSTCFGSPFMVHRPQVYGDLLARKITETGANVYLVNTGWVGGGYAVSKRIDINTTRGIIHAVEDGTIRNATFKKDPIFGFEYAVNIPGVVSNELDPEATWEDKEAFKAMKNKLAKMFVDNFKKFNAPEISQYQPKI